MWRLWGNLTQKRIQVMYRWKVDDYLMALPRCCDKCCEETGIGQNAWVERCCSCIRSTKQTNKLRQSTRAFYCKSKGSLSLVFGFIVLWVYLPLGLQLFVYLISTQTCRLFQYRECVFSSCVGVGGLGAGVCISKYNSDGVSAICRRLLQQLNRPRPSSFR